MKPKLPSAVLAALVATPLAWPPSALAQGGGAAPRSVATAEEIRQLREQLQALTARLEQLERANAELEAPDGVLQRPSGPQVEVEETVVALPADADATFDRLAKTRAHAPDWAGRYVLRGDLRYRHERIESGGDRAVAGPAGPVVGSLDRVRDRIRFRFGGALRVNDTVTVGVRLASGGNDPRSVNQTLSDQSSRKPIGLDQAFVAWQPTRNWLVRAGKIPQPWTRPGSSLLFDSDVNPEGVAVNWQFGHWFANGSYLWLQERGPTIVAQGQGQVDVSDPAMGHLQAGVRRPFTATSSITVGASYYDHFAVRGRRPFFGGDPNGNTVASVAFPAAGTALVDVAAYDYDVLQVFAQYDRVVFDTLPLMAYADWARNRDGRFRTAWSTGFMLGRAANPGDWELGALYQVVGKDALFGQWVDSDFGNGATDARGWALRGGWAPLRSLSLSATLFLNELNVDGFGPVAPRGRSYQRLQLDANLRL